MAENRKATIVVNATTYPRNHALLEQEMDKILREGWRRENIKKVERYLKTQLGASSKVSTRSPKAGRKGSGRLAVKAKRK